MHLTTLIVHTNAYINDAIFNNQFKFQNKGEISRHYMRL